MAPDPSRPTLAAERRRRMLGRYEIVAEIARGGMGAVYLARTGGVGGFQRLFAIKVLHRHLADEERFINMLLDEARLAAQLHHPNAVGILDVSDSPIGYYLVMQYVDGFSLEQLLERIDDPILRAKVGLRAVIDSANGLHAAHVLKDEHDKPLGIVHRDVSPQNILLGADGSGRITDFGVARAAARITASHPGMIKGKPNYMAPEQAQSRPLDARADVFALGIVLWEAFTGRRLFDGDGGPAVVLLQVVNGEIPAPSTMRPELPKALEEACLGALERSLDRRTESARRFARDLEKATAGTDWLLSSHDVADLIGELFAEELEQRRHAIKAHLRVLEGGAEEMELADLVSVPRLRSAPAMASIGATATPEPWHETPTSGELPRASSTASGLTARSEANTIAVQHASLVPGNTTPITMESEPAPEEAGSSTNDAPAAQSQAPAGPSMRLAGGILFVGALLAAAALWAITSPPETPSNEAAAEAADVAAEARAAAAAAEAEAASQAAEAEATAEQAQNTEQDHAVDTEESGADAVDSAEAEASAAADPGAAVDPGAIEHSNTTDAHDTDETAMQARSQRTRRPRRPRNTAATETPMAAPMQAAPMEAASQTTPRLEGNPYLR